MPVVHGKLSTVYQERSRQNLKLGVSCHYTATVYGLFAGCHSRNQSHSCRAVTQMVSLKEHHMPSTPSNSTSHIYVEASPVESAGSHRQLGLAEGGGHWLAMEDSPSVTQPQISLAVNAETRSQHEDLLRLSDNYINNDEYIDKTLIS